MKKKYIAPSMEIIEIEPEQILAGSVDASDELYNGSLNAPRKRGNSNWEILNEE